MASQHVPAECGAYKVDVGIVRCPCCELLIDTATNAEPAGDLAEVLALETQVTDLADRLTSYHPEAAKVARDYLGTLHVNLCQLVRKATQARDALERKHSFTR